MGSPVIILFSSATKNSIQPRTQLARNLNFDLWRTKVSHDLIVSFHKNNGSHCDLSLLGMSQLSQQSKNMRTKKSRKGRKSDWIRHSKKHFLITDAFDFDDFGPLFSFSLSVTESSNEDLKLEFSSSAKRQACERNKCWKSTLWPVVCVCVCVQVDSMRGWWWLNDLHMCLLLFSIGVSH